MEEDRFARDASTRARPIVDIQTLRKNLAFAAILVTHDFIRLASCSMRARRSATAMHWYRAAQLSPQWIVRCAAQRGAACATTP